MDNSGKYEVKLNNFDGPLDLLLQLISKAKIEIKDIFVSEITDQYLRYLAETDMDDLENSSEFLEMAATLLYIKSRALLPRIKEESDEDPEGELIARLEEYRRYREAAEEMRFLEGAARDIYYKLPEEIADTREDVYLNADTVLLYEAMKELLLRTGKNRAREEEVVIRQDYVSVHAQMRMIRNKLRRKESVSFFSLFSENPSRMEIAVTFYALLELINQGRITITQKDAFGDISIMRREKEKNGQK